MAHLKTSSSFLIHPYGELRPADCRRDLPEEYRLKSQYRRKMLHFAGGVIPADYQQTTGGNKQAFTRGNRTTTRGYHLPQVKLNRWRSGSRCSN
ncbi:hypothetical protein BCR37DRAFT_383441 [Protomyces lactucae-debilis]|uniref:Uncharacterized protein n=1 Tax=Protomyces lactucae-debilis TaxID=2754530 RepID=A0A1Y2EXK7_PROLT|nr:uncharacterized protein BCR37DRAFT_383441 [Protomyces lactucae-debilis]ORY76352.1 hypothetical protein BCR37DRAFT_383441 [Protomyces lactucae-debilis]